MQKRHSGVLLPPPRRNEICNIQYCFKRLRLEQLRFVFLLDASSRRRWGEARPHFPTTHGDVIREGTFSAMFAVRGVGCSVARAARTRTPENLAPFSDISVVSPDSS